MLSKAKLSSALLTAAAALATVLFLVFPARYAQAVRDGIDLWAANVLPAAFFMLFLTAFLTRRAFFRKLTCLAAPLSERLFAVPGAGGCAALLSIVSGYPVGAKTVLDLSRAGYLGKEDRFRTACLATTSGPAFLVGAVGCGMFRSAAAGWLLYGSHLFGIFLVCLVLRAAAKERPKGVLPPPTEKLSLAEILQSSVLSVLTVGAAIAVFYTFGEMIADMGALFSLPYPLETFLRGLLEMTSGCALAAKFPSALSLAAACFFTTFGGLSAIVQQLAFLIPAGIDAGRFVLVKLVQGALSGAAAFGLGLLFF